MIAYHCYTSVSTKIMTRKDLIQSKPKLPSKRDPQGLKLGCEEKNLTVLFSDLVGFTTISKKMPPHEVVTLLSQYFDEVTKIIFENQGALKEYVADELMAIFGAPIYQSNHAERACKSAHVMRHRLRELRK